MHDLSGKQAFVTGGGQGIGRAIVEKFAASGAQVTAADLNADTLAELTTTANVVTVTVDVTNDAALRAAIMQAAPDVLVNVAGVVHHGTLLDCKVEELDFAFALNVRAMFVACQAALGPMQANRNGSIINISSVASSIRGVPLRCAYGTTKAAVIGLTKSIAADYAKDLLRCNAICPGTVRSPSWEERVGEMAEREGISKAAALQVFVDRQQMGRVGEPDEIAALAAYLASNDAVFVTGQELCIDGGWSV